MIINNVKGLSYSSVRLITAMNGKTEEDGFLRVRHVQNKSNPETPARSRQQTGHPASGVNWYNGPNGRACTPTPQQRAKAAHRILSPKNLDKIIYETAGQALTTAGATTSGDCAERSPTNDAYLGETLPQAPCTTGRISS